MSNVLQDIFKDHYEEMLYILHPRKSVIENVDRMINCGDPSFGGAMYGCSTCGTLNSGTFALAIFLCVKHKFLSTASALWCKDQMCTADRLSILNIQIQSVSVYNAYGSVIIVLKTHLLGFILSVILIHLLRRPVHCFLRPHIVDDRETIHIVQQKLLIRVTIIFV